MNTRKTTIHLLAAALLAGLCTTSRADLLSFGVGSSLRLPGYTEGDLQIESLSFAMGPTFAGIRDWNSYSGLGSQHLEGVGVGERELMMLGAVGTVRFSRTNGAVFDLTHLSIDDPRGAADWSFYGSVRITGSNGLSADLNANAFGTHDLGDLFRGISWFTLKCNDFGSCQAAVDDIEYADPAAVGSVSTMGTLPLTLLAAALLGHRVARRRRA